jgi:hypothetical protein
MLICHGLWRSLVSALDWGSRGRGFKSPQPDGKVAGEGLGVNYKMAPPMPLAGAMSAREMAVAITDPVKAIIAITGLRSTAQQASQLWADWYAGSASRPSGTHPYEACQAQMARQLALIEAIAREVDREIAGRLRDHLRKGHNDSIVDDCDLLIGALERQHDIEEIVGPTGPKLALGQMHPWVHENAAERWENGQRRDAVQAASTALFNIHLPAKLGLPKDTAPEALCAAFKTDDATRTQSRLRCCLDSKRQRQPRTGETLMKVLSFSGSLASRQSETSRHTP